MKSQTKYIHSDISAPPNLPSATVGYQVPPAPNQAGTGQAAATKHKDVTCEVEPSSNRQLGR